MRYFKRTGSLVGGAIGLALISLFYLGEQLFRLPFLPFDLFDWLARALPGDLVTLGIDSIVDSIIFLNLGASTSETAKQIELLLALTLFVFIWAGIGFLAALLTERSRFSGQQTAVSLAAIFALAAVGIESSLGRSGLPGFPWLALLSLGGGWLLGRVLDDLRAAETAVPQRRHFLVILGTAAVAWAAGRLFGRPPADTGAAQTIQTESAAMADVVTDPADLQDRLEPASGTRPEITPDGEFYRIDINTRPPAIAEAEWELQVEGLFDNPHSLTLPDLMAMPAVTQPLTLSCISNRIGGDLISTAEWTGVRLGVLLAEMGLQPAAQELAIEAADGFYESVAMADLMDPRTLLVYAMNGQTLPQRHGFPLRIYIPNRYGMKQPKWITRIEAIAGEGAGYWVDRGWSEEARPHVVSVIDTVAQEERDADGRIPLGGIAWAGDRGIQQVEVQIDDAPWQTARLRTPPLSTLTWVQWRYDWPAAPGRHTFRVRATDGDGARQIGEETGVRPDGATGYHTLTATIA